MHLKHRRRRRRDLGDCSSWAEEGAHSSNSNSNSNSSSNSSSSSSKRRLKALPSLYDIKMRTVHQPCRQWEGCSRWVGKGTRAFSSSS